MEINIVIFLTKTIGIDLSDMEIIKGLEIKSSSRIIWLNSEARRTWEKPMKDMNRMISELELLSVKEMHRSCATITDEPMNIINIENRYPELIFKPIRAVGKFKGFSHRHLNPKETGGQYYIHYVVSRKLEVAETYKQAYINGDHDTQGKFLAFPECCRKFFIDTWSKGYVDPTYQMKGRGKPHPYSNPLLRYLGIRVSFHMPCSFNCEGSIKLGMARKELAKRNEYEDTWKLMEAILSMDMEWDCLHGISVVKTPIFWVILQSTPTIERHRVKIKGSFIPREI